MDKKPPQRVRAIQGEFKPDIITREELAEISKLQATAWAADQEAHAAVLIIEQRLLNGAQVEDCDLFFDPDLRMIRTKRKEGSG